MSDHSTSSHAHNDAEIETFRAEDYAAGKAVVILMLGIFSTGVVLYSIVAYTVMF
jgi:hypothetical protein